MSALPPKADIAKHCWDVRFVPLGDELRQTLQPTVTGRRRVERKMRPIGPFSPDDRGSPSFRHGKSYPVIWEREGILSVYRPPGSSRPPEISVEHAVWLSRRHGFLVGTARSLETFDPAVSLPFEW